MNTERIYIGGLSPSKGLTVSLVASRLMSVKNVEIVSINDAPINSCGALEQQGKYTVVDADGDLVDLREFFFLEARCTSSNDVDGQHSALDLLAKQYNNTKWKGCNLRVESARPHFLKRLEIERAERKARELTKDVSAIEDGGREHNAQEVNPDGASADEQATKETHNVRRRLRIKKRFGEEAYHVDAHPQILYITDDSEWAKFASLHRKMKDKFTSQRMKLVERRKAERKSWMMKGSKDGKEPSSDLGEDLRGLMFLNRGIHIRFDARGDDNLHASSSDDCIDEIENEAKEAYFWSDAESTEDTSEVAAATSDDGSLGSGGSKANSEGDSEVSTDDEGIDDRVKDVRGYVWSDNDSDNMTKPKKSSEFRLTNALDEFSGGVDFGEDNSNNSYKSDDEENTALSQFDDDVSVKLEEDIRSNLGILSKLFPGESVSDTPLKVAAVDAESAFGSIEKSKPSSAFGAGLIVQRYDPTKEDAATSMHSDVAKENTDQPADSDDDNKSEADEVSAESSDNQPVTNDEQLDETGDIDSESNEGNKVDAAGNTTSSRDQSDSRQALQDDTGNDVYEQDKLESIFKQAREQQQNTGFSFGAMFDSQLGDAAANHSDFTSENTGGLVFSFGFSDVANEPTLEDATKQTEPSNSATKQTPTKQTPKEHKRKSRVGLRFPTSVLDEYESLFFSLNEGPQIIADMKSIQNNEEIQEKWQKKREVLTSDWKRKQKGALSRKVKKVRKY
ncbi:hypothetical protein ACHAWO_004092 [Cyclotella atomus]|uniref:Uncharacterized protein n=1 Tax=Cyclotella atomus TaxID=382360 RepID=A0ABD3NR88_9STRA